MAEQNYGTILTGANRGKQYNPGSYWGLGLSNAHAGQIIEMPDGSFKREGYLFDTTVDRNKLGDFKSLQEYLKVNPDFDSGKDLATQQKDFNAGKLAEQNAQNVSTANAIGWANTGLGALGLGANMYYANANLQAQKAAQTYAHRRDKAADEKVKQFQNNAHNFG